MRRLYWLGTHRAGWVKVWCAGVEREASSAMIFGRGSRSDMEHCIGRSMLSQRVRVHLVGVGGNGAQMANCLARLDIAMRALGHPYGLHVTAFDGDQVSESNVGR